MGTWMRAVAIWLMATLAVAASAAAEEIEDNALWIKPKYDLLKAKWPRESGGKLIYGKVLLDCGVGMKGVATDCKVKASSPANPLLEQAALDLAPQYRA